MNIKNIIYILIILLIVSGFFYLFKSSFFIQKTKDNTPTTQNTNESKDISTQIQTTQKNMTSSKKTYNISIINFSFNPNTLTVNQGDTVIWTNEDSAPHQININDINGQIISKNGTFSFTFDNAGTFNYYCSIHPSMVGNIVVK